MIKKNVSDIEAQKEPSIDVERRLISEEQAQRIAGEIKKFENLVDRI